MGLRFGTDGIRGIANAELSAELVVALGRAIARVLPAKSFVIGRDTRRSGPLLQAALSAGLASEGTDVVDLGVIPTPGVAWVAGRDGVPGAMVSASHNPFADNGIKVFAAGGLKLPDEVEEAIEEEMSGLVAQGTSAHERARAAARTGRSVGAFGSDHGAIDDYARHLVRVTGGRDLSGMRLVLDCANGAASTVGPRVFEMLGAQVVALAAAPDGANINEGCGSTHPEILARTVTDAGADLGLAFDGDADRLVAVAHTGEVATGDELLALFAVDMAESGRLAKSAVVITVMANLGLRIALEESGISLHETPVGDRYVLAALNEHELSLGGEQSGHLVFPDLATTGDGILTGVLLADLVKRKGRAFADLAASSMSRVPQLLVNVEADDPGAVVGYPVVVAAVERERSALGPRGRVLLRASGTEPVVRVMVEAEEHDAASEAVSRLRAAVERASESVSP